MGKNQNRTTLIAMPNCISVANKATAKNIKVLMKIASNLHTVENNWTEPEVCVSFTLSGGNIRNPVCFRQYRQHITRCFLQHIFSMCLGDNYIFKIYFYCSRSSGQVILHGLISRDPPPPKQLNGLALKQRGSSPSHAAGTASRPFGLIYPLTGPADSTSAARKISWREAGEPCIFFNSALFIYVFIKFVQNQEKKEGSPPFFSSPLLK